MDQVSNVFNGFTSLMDQNIRGVQLGCYSVALVGLTVAMRKVRPLSKFKTPSDIPNHFLKERRELTGIVKRIDPNGPLLMIQHKPLINIPVVPSGQLPVKITGVNVSGLGISWLQAVVVGTEVKFVPVLKRQDLVECEVLLLQQTKDKGSCFVNLGENLVKIGFGLPGTVQKPLINSPKLVSYYNRLQSAELYAIKKNLGSKYYLKQKKKIHTINVGENLVRIGFGMTDSIEKSLADDPLLLRYFNQLQKAEQYAIRKKLGLRYYLKPTRQALTALGVYLSILLGKTYQKTVKLIYKLPKMYAA